MGITLLIPITSFIFAYTHITLIDKYRSINDRLLTEYQLISSANDIVSSYNSAIQLNSPGRVEAYRSARRNMNVLISGLTPPNYNQSYQLQYQGVATIIAKITSNTDAGIGELAEGGIVGTTLHFDQAATLLPYLKDSVSDLILIELENGIIIQKQIKSIERVGLIGGMLVTGMMVLLSMVISYRLAQEITGPLSRLANNASRVSPERQNQPLDEDLQSRGDEIGVLARSLQGMIDGLHGNVMKVMDSNRQLTEMANQMTKNNADLERFNKLTVNRELTMIELKKEIGTLKLALQKANVKPPISGKIV